MIAKIFTNSYNYFKQNTLIFVQECRLLCNEYYMYYLADKFDNSLPLSSVNTHLTIFNFFGLTKWTLAFREIKQVI